MDYILRDKSVISSSNSLEPLHEMKNFPVFIGTTDKKEDEDLFADMDWYICKDSGVIQLKNLLPLDVVYSEYHSEAVGGVWKEHHLSFVDFASKFANNNILEVGGSNGFIGNNFVDKNKNKQWTIIEPNPGFVSNEKVKVIKGFFDKKFVDDSVDTIVHSHVIEHMYNPKEFLQDVSEFLQDGEYQIFSIPNLKRYLENKFTNTINFEHTFFLTEELMDYLLSLYKFEIIEKRYFNDHSIFYATKKNSQLRPVSLINYYDEYKKIYNDFILYYESEVEKLNNLIANYDGKIYLFGAHIFSQFLIYMGLNIDKIDLILDNSTGKAGQRLYGTNKKVALPSTIEDIEKVAVIVKAGQYQEEVKKQLKTINKNCIIWE